MRKLKRAMARHKMQKEGIRHVNRSRVVVDPRTGIPVKIPSYFAENWRAY